MVGCPVLHSLDEESGQRQWWLPGENTIVFTDDVVRAYVVLINNQEIQEHFMQTVILTVLIAALTPVCNVTAQVDPIERSAVIAPYTATNGPG